MFRITHGVLSQTIVESEAELLSEVAGMVAAGCMNILITREPTDVTVEQDVEGASLDTVARFTFDVRVAR